MRNTLQTVDFDFSPLFRSSIGFDRMMRQMQNLPKAEANNYPPYNIERQDDHAYSIELAVAGFKPEDLEIEVEGNQLSIQGKVKNKIEGDYLHKGIAMRDFEQRFQLADHIEVKEVSLEDGLLSIALQREVPEQLKPKKIEIKNKKPLIGKSKKG